MDIQGSRPNEFVKVAGWLDSDARPGKVDIYGISGHGGVGKSYLLNHAREHAAPVSKGYLEITVDASDTSILGDFMELYGRKFAPRALAKGKPNYDYFPHARVLARRHAKLAKRIEGAIDQSDMSEVAKKAARVIFSGLTTISKCSEKAKKLLDFEALEEAGAVEGIDAAIDFLSSLGGVAGESRLPGPVKNVLGISYKERLSNDFYGLSADELVSDLSAILNHPQLKNGHRLAESPIAGLDRLLLVIDDFEVLAGTIAEFVATALIPALERASFHSTIIIVGRDPLANTHVAFQHHLAPLVRESIRLERFSLDIAEQMFREAGHSDADIPTLLKESEGNPFLVSLLCEVKGGSVSFYQQFYERTTRWMTPTQKEWVIPLCYLDLVTEPAVEAMMPEAPTRAVMEWFTHEASLRDPNGQWYAIAPYIRRTLREYHCKEIGTRRQMEFVSRGAEASLLA